MSLFGKGKKYRNFNNPGKKVDRRGRSEREDFEEEYEEEDSGDFFYEEDSEEGYYEAEESEEEYYEAEESGEEYYEAEESGEEYYEAEEAEDGYYEAEESEEEYYEAEDSEEELPEENTYYGEEYGDENAGYYEEEYGGDNADYYEEEYDGVDSNYEDSTEDADNEEEDEADLYYIEEGEYEDYEEEEEEGFRAHYRKKKGVAGAVLAFKSLPLIDKVIACTGVAVLVFGVITASLYLSFRNETKEVAAFAEVGSSLKDVKIIGESGLLAVADAQAAKEAAAEETEMEKTEVSVVEDEKKGANVLMKMTSIVKDLKIKFVNEETDKLIASVPFQVEVKTPAGKTETWTDDDKDGIIYKEEIAAGKYEVKLLALDDEKFADYKLDTSTQKMDVKANIEYKKVDVAEEIKTEAEVNAAVEDTAVEEVVEESKLTDTVPFIQHTETSGEVSYKQVDISTIPAPKAVATASVDTETFYLMTQDVSGDDHGTDPEGTGGTGNTGTGGTGGIETDPNPDITQETPSPQLTVNPAEITLKVGTSGEITVTTNLGTITCSVDNSSIASAEVSGKTIKVTGKSAGKTAVKIFAASTDESKTASASCIITVEDADSIKLDHTSLEVAVGGTATATATTVPADATITATSGNEKVAKVSCNGKTITVTGVAKGSAKITVKSSKGQTAELSVTVINDPKYDTVSKLKDKDGNQVYVQENGKYREAVYADYYKSGMVFYIQTTEILYTGWTTVNGKTYYYLENHKYVTGEQVIQGAKYTFASDGTMVTSSGTFGIDVSKWNGNINWNSVKDSGVSYAIIRCGYRGSSTGALITDPKFAANISGANAAGIKTGVYFFTQAVNEKEAVEEASMVLSLVKKYKISYPIFLDVESSNGRADGIDKATRTAVCKAFCATIQNSGYTAGVYANKTWLNNKIDAGALSSYKIWLAQYASAPTYNGRYNLWQYSSKGSIQGISGHVDLNKSFLGY